MPYSVPTTDQTRRVRQLLADAHNIVITCHMTPDGDALGSSLCLYHTLCAMERNVRVVVPDAYPENLAFLPGARSIIVASYHPRQARTAFSQADLIFCLDFNDPARIDRMEPMLTAAKAPKVVIDHHLNPEINADVIISAPHKSSTCALLFMTLHSLGLLPALGLEAATCCCAGMMTDTGNFSYNSNDPELYSILAELVRIGVDKDALYARIFNTNSETRVRIMGYGQFAKMQIFPDHRAAVITLSRDELNMLDYHRGDTEALVNVPLSIPGIVWSVFLREDEPNYVKVSMRSKGEFSVKEICAGHFGGGGHKNASGGEMHAPLDQVLRTLLDLMPLYDRFLPEPQPENQ